jgi:hypothetical protein
MNKQIFISVLLSLFGMIVIAQENNIPLRVFNTTRIIDAPPVIDGIPDDEAWEIVEWSGDFTQKEPYEYGFQSN